jgi:hypothetical protein
MDDAAKQRAELRRQRAHEWPVRAYRLEAEPSVDPFDRSTIDERLATMWPLARAAWSVAGNVMPSYARGEVPGRMIRGGSLR